MRPLRKYLPQQPDPRTETKSTAFVYDIRAALELELERFPVYTHMDRWERVVDHSLRGDHAGEYRCRYPFGTYDLEKALIEFENARGHIIPSISHRCSTHVHVDFRDKTEEQLAKVMLVTLLVEPLLLHYVGEQRAYSQYALPLSYTKPPIKLSQSCRMVDAHAEEAFFHALNNACKYNALNFLTLGKYGSLEFRYLGGEYRKPELMRWLNIIFSICKHGCESDFSLLGEVEYLENVGVESYVKNIFGEYTDFLIYPGYIRDVTKNIVHAYIFASGYMEEELDIINLDIMKEVGSGMISELFKHSLPEDTTNLSAVYRSMSHTTKVRMLKKHSSTYDSLMNESLTKLNNKLG